MIKVGIIGATGVVGRKVLQSLEKIMKLRS